jgi:hypothetical protein
MVRQAIRRSDGYQPRFHAVLMASFMATSAATSSSRSAAKAPTCAAKWSIDELVVHAE